MATFRESLLNALNTNAGVIAALPGGVKDHDTLPYDGGGATAAPRASDGVTLLPYAVMNFGEYARLAPQSVQAFQGFIEIYVYAETGISALQAGASAIGKALDNQYWHTDDVALAHTIEVGGTRRFTAREVGRPTQMVRIQVVHVRT
jgi:hypothetical protein